MGANVILQTGGMSAEDMLAKIVGTEPFALTADDLAGLTEVHEDAFNGCATLTSIELPSGTMYIGSRAFYDCENLELISIPNSVLAIGSLAFEGCDNLATTNLEWYGGFITIDGVEYSGAMAGSSDNNAKYFIIPPSNDGSNVIAIMNEPYGFSSNSNLEYVRLPDTLLSIGRYAFTQCTNLSDIRLPSSLLEIREGAFSGCSDLLSIEIPNSVIIMEQSAFSGCSSLVSVTISNSIETLETGVFNGCSSLGTVSIPDSVTTIGWQAFGYCTNLGTVEIPLSVNTISGNAFANCTSLTSIIYGGTMDEWRHITFGDWWDSFTGEYIVHCTDGDIPKQ